jgi:hypothetical protein
LEISAQIQSITRNQWQSFFRPGVLMSGAGARTDRQKASRERDTAPGLAKKAGWLLMGGTMKNQTSPDFFSPQFWGPVWLALQVIGGTWTPSARWSNPGYEQEKRVA